VDYIAGFLNGFNVRPASEFVVYRPPILLNVVAEFALRLWAIGQTISSMGLLSDSL
jgi:hypothetical protein